MKKYLYLAAAALLLTACVSRNTPEATQKVSFELLGLDVTTEAMAPARNNSTPAQANITDIWVLEGTETLCHQVNTDENFGNPSIALTYGQHNLAFICSGQTGQSVTNGVFTSDNAKETFGKMLNINVNAGTGKQAIVVDRLCYGIKWISTDLIPTEAMSVKLTIANHRNSIGSDLAGGNTAIKHWGYADISAYHGQTLSVTAYGFPAINGEEDQINTTITFYDASGNVLYTHTKTVPAMNNRQTKITGVLCSAETPAAVSVNNDWGSSYDVGI